MKIYCLVSAKPWHDVLFNNLKSRKDEKWIRISKKEDFNLHNLREQGITKVFVPHWSYIIQSEIYSNVECIVFHMTDLPYGRGGSPLQNLIARGHHETKISAIKVSKGIDTGDIYLKRPLSLHGSATEIFLRSVPFIQEMIEMIIDHDISPQPQEGEVVEFKRRKPSQGSLDGLSDLLKAYDFIRMLDCDGYPPAFIESTCFKFEFKNSSLNADGSVSANVRISYKKENTVGGGPS